MSTSAELQKATKDVETMRLSLQKGIGLRATLSVFAGNSPTAESIEDIEPFELSLKEHLEAHPLDQDIANPFDYEVLLSSGVEYLARALSFRDDGQDLSLQAVNAITEQWRRGCEIDSAQRGLDAASQELESQQKLIQSLAATITAMDKDMAAAKKGDIDLKLRLDYRDLKLRHETASASAALMAARLDSSRLDLEQMRLLAEFLKARGTKAGHALNFRERIATARRSFLQNATEACHRLQAAAHGMAAVFSRSPAPEKLPPFPVLDATAATAIGYVDRLLEWSRASLFALDHLHAASQEYRVVLSLKTLSEVKYPKVRMADNSARLDNTFPFAGITGREGELAESVGKQIDAGLYGAGATLGNVGMWENIFLDGKGRFYQLDLTRQDFAHMRHPRLAAISVSVVPKGFTVSSEAEYKVRHSQWPGVIRLPEQRLNGDSVPRQQIAFGDAGPYGESSAQLTGQLLRNLDPCGMWMIAIPHIAHLNNDASPPADVWLELIVTGKPAA